MTLFPQIGLQIQHNLYQNPNWLLCRNWQAGSTMSAEIQGLKQKEQSWGSHFPISNFTAELE